MHGNDLYDPGLHLFLDDDEVQDHPRFVRKVQHPQHIQSEPVLKPDRPWEGHAVQLRFESFNFTNTPNFGRPNTAIGTAAAGTITTAQEPRRIQFGLKYVF